MTWYRSTRKNLAPVFHVCISFLKFSMARAFYSLFMVKAVQRPIETLGKKIQDPGFAFLHLCCHFTVLHFHKVCKTLAALLCSTAQKNWPETTAGWFSGSSYSFRVDLLRYAAWNTRSFAVLANAMKLGVLWQRPASMIGPCYNPH